MKIHFIAIGGSAMHNLAIALHNKGEHVTGSDDEIFDPSRTRLAAKGLLPEQYGWFEDNILGDENGGGLWFDENMKLQDYDGVYFLPADVRNQLMKNNFITQEMYEDSSSS